MKTAFDAAFEIECVNLETSYRSAISKAYINRHSMRWVAFDTATHSILAEGEQRRREERKSSPLYVDFDHKAEPQRLPDGSAPPLASVYGLEVRIDDTAPGIRWDIGIPVAVPFDVDRLESSQMTTVDQAIPEAIEELPHADADVLLDVVVGASAGLVGAVTPLHSITDAELYGIMIRSIPKMIAAQGGPEASQIILAAAITRLVRQKMEATT